MNNKFIIKPPEVIRIEPSGLCNLLCSHCPTGTIKQKRGIMNLETFAIVLKYIESHSKNIRVVVLYHGGEPLLNKHFFDMADRIKKIGIPLIKTVSNGMLINESLIHELVYSGIDAIEISLDGTSPIENNIIRRKSDFEIISQNIKNLIEYKQKNNLAKPDVTIVTTQFIDENFDLSDPEPDCPPIPEYLLQEFDSYVKDNTISFKSTYALEWPHMIIDEKIYGVREYLFENNLCDHVINTLTVRWNGDVVPCCYDLTSKYILGNVNKEEIDKIWNNEKAIAIRESINKKEFNNLCNNCAIVGNKRYLLLNRQLLESNK